jgi:hypothetical protein
MVGIGERGDDLGFRRKVRSGGKSAKKTLLTSLGSRLRAFFGKLSNLHLHLNKLANA